MSRTVSSNELNLSVNLLESLERQLFKRTIHFCFFTLLLGKLLFVRNWEQNRNLHGLLAKSAKPIVEYHRIPLKSGYDAFVKLQFPPGADFSAKHKYPMLIDVYGGPGSFAGADRWGTTFTSYLVTNRKYIVVQINGRGSGNRGQKLLHEIYRRMGTVEIEDQLEAAQYVTMNTSPIK